MRIHNDANMSFHKTTWQSPPIIAATGVGSLSLPSSHQVSSLNARTGTRRGRAVHNQPVTSVPGSGPAPRAPQPRPTPPRPRAAPHTARCDRQAFPAPPHARSPATQNRWPVTTTSTLSCPRRSSRPTRTPTPPPRRCCFISAHTYRTGCPTPSGSTGSTPRGAPRHRRVEVPQRYQRTRQRGETPLQRQTESSSSATPAAK